MPYNMLNATSKKQTISMVSQHNVAVMVYVGRLMKGLLAANCRVATSLNERRQSS